MNMLYNEELKERYLSTYENEQSQNTLRHVFYKAELVEGVLEKDLFDFNLSEFAKVIKNSNPHNKSVAKSYARFFITVRIMGNKRRI